MPHQHQIGYQVLQAQRGLPYGTDVFEPLVLVHFRPADIKQLRETNDGGEQDFADRMNGLPKYAATTTLDTLTWNDATSISGTGKGSSRMLTEPRRNSWRRERPVPGLYSSYTRWHGERVNNHGLSGASQGSVCVTYSVGEGTAILLDAVDRV